MSFYGWQVIAWIDDAGHAIDYFPESKRARLMESTRCPECGYIRSSTVCLHCAAMKAKRERKPPIKLSREQIFLIHHGGRPKISYPGDEPCPVAVGTVRYLTAQLAIEVLEVRRSKKGDWVLHYLIRDERPVLLRRVPPVHTTEINEGFVKPPTRADIEVARIEGSYTRSSHGSVPDAGESVLEVDHNLLSMRARTKWAESRESSPETQKHDLRALTSAVMETGATMVKNGVDPTPFLADVQRVLVSHQDELERAA